MKTKDLIDYMLMSIAGAVLFISIVLFLGVITTGEAKRKMANLKSKADKFELVSVFILYGFIFLESLLVFVRYIFYK